MGAAPAREAKAASERKRPGCDQEARSWAAVIGPTPGSARSAGASVWTSWWSSASSSAASAVRVSARRAVDRRAMIVALCSVEWAVFVRRRAQRCSCLTVVSWRSRHSHVHPCPKGKRPRSCGCGLNSGGDGSDGGTDGAGGTDRLLLVGPRWPFGALLERPGKLWLGLVVRAEAVPAGSGWSLSKRGRPGPPLSESHQCVVKAQTDVLAPKGASRAGSRLKGPANRRVLRVPSGAPKGSIRRQQLAPVSFPPSAEVSLDQGTAVAPVVAVLVDRAQRQSLSFRRPKKALANSGGRKRLLRHRFQGRHEGATGANSPSPKLRRSAGLAL
jgi:hypothetical protein